MRELTKKPNRFTEEWKVGDRVVFDYNDNYDLEGIIVAFENPDDEFESANCIVVATKTLLWEEDLPFGDEDGYFPHASDKALTKPYYGMYWEWFRADQLSKAPNIKTLDELLYDISNETSN